MGCLGVPPERLRLLPGQVYVPFPGEVLLTPVLAGAHPVTPGAFGYPALQRCPSLPAPSPLERHSLRRHCGAPPPRSGHRTYQVLRTRGTNERTHTEVPILLDAKLPQDQRGAVRPDSCAPGPSTRTPDRPVTQFDTGKHGGRGCLRCHVHSHLHQNPAVSFL